MAFQDADSTAGAAPGAMPPTSAHALFVVHSDSGVVPSERCTQTHWEQAWTGAAVQAGTTHPMQLLRDSITAAGGGHPIDDLLINTATHLVLTAPRRATARGGVHAGPLPPARDDEQDAA